MAVIERTDLGNCAVLTMNRPSSLNAITTEMLEQLDHELDVIEQDSTRAFLLTGTGRGFCPGTDLKEPPKDTQQRINQVHQLVLRMVNFSKLSVAAINGLALGGGLELAMACNFRVAAPEAKLGLPEIKIGLMPAYGGTALLPRLVGSARAECERAQPAGRRVARREERCRDEVDVDGDDRADERPERSADGAAVCKRAHDPRIAGEEHERHDGERELHGLKHIQVLVRVVPGLWVRLAHERNRDGRPERERAREECPLPSLDPEREEALHYVLTRKRARHRARLASGEQPDCPHQPRG